MKKLNIGKFPHYLSDPTLLLRMSLTEVSGVDGIVDLAVHAEDGVGSVDGELLDLLPVGVKVDTSNNMMFGSSLFSGYTL